MVTLAVAAGPAGDTSLESGDVVETVAPLVPSTTSTTTTTTFVEPMMSVPIERLDTTSTSPPTTVATTTSTTTTTTAPPTTTTAPPPPTTTAAIVALADDPDGQGVLVTPTGVVAPVIGGGQGAWRILTPCANEATIAGGTFVGHVDVVIDPGHGGSEPGAVGPNGITEKALNLEIALLVQDHLEADGFTVLLTRTSDIRIPIRTRGDIANALQPDLFVSLHHNGGPTATTGDVGTEVYFQSNSENSRRAAALVYDQLADAMREFPVDWVATNRAGTNIRLNEAGEDLYGIHRYTPGVPSIITEALYLSNGPEAELLERADVQAAEARAIALGILQYLWGQDAGNHAFAGEWIDGSSSGTGGFGGCVDPKLE